MSSATRVALRHLRARGAQLSGGQRAEYLDAVWDMYVRTYSRIGMSVSSASQMLSKYPVWELSFNRYGEPIAFSVFKTTSYGLKAALSGYDGSQEGKSVTLNNLRTKFKRSGIYGEVSHKVKVIVLSSGSPVVCAAFASSVLGKSVELVNAITYERTLGGVGRVQKTMVGNPKGIPTTSASNPSCPVVVIDSRVAAEDDGMDLDSHYEALMISALM